MVLWGIDVRKHSINNIQQNSWGADEPEEAEAEKLKAQEAKAEAAEELTTK